MLLISGGIKQSFLDAMSSDKELILSKDRQLRLGTVALQTGNHLSQLSIVPVNIGPVGTLINERHFKRFVRGFGSIAASRGSWCQAKLFGRFCHGTCKTTAVAVERTLASSSSRSTCSTQELIDVAGNRFECQNNGNCNRRHCQD